MDISDYCRQIETYLCQKNDGHLIRVVGPSFERVSRWATDGVPLKVALRGIDRYFERYYAKGPRRRPVRVDFCEADVLDVFEEWRRAVGLTYATAPTVGRLPVEDPTRASTPERRGASLPAHLERVVTRLSSARATGALGPEADALIDRAVHELDEARAMASGLRGSARTAMIERLSLLDAEIVRVARSRLPEPERLELEREADQQLAAFRQGMSGETYRRARDSALDTLARERFQLPLVAFR